MMAIASARFVLRSRRAEFTPAIPTPIEGRTQWHQLDNYSYEDFIREYKKSHLLTSSAEYEYRKSVFEKNLAMIKAHNANPHRTYNMNVNHFADLTQEEFVSMYTGYAQGLAMKHRNLKTSFVPEFPKVYKTKDYPKSIDWRTKGITTPVKNQGQCGSCWAFAATACYESHAALATGKLVTLSPQQITSCAPNPHKCGGTGGCEGATAEIAYEYTSTVGITAESSYPYTSGTTTRTGTCYYPNATMPTVFRNKGYKQLPTNDLNSHLDGIQNGPMVISVAASAWAFYDSGIFNGCSNNLDNVDVNHAVVLEGYGEEANGQKYWIVRNSWGPNWGENGYIRLARRDVEVCGTDPTPEHGYVCENGPTSLTVCGECGMLSDTAYPTGITVA